MTTEATYQTRLERILGVPLAEDAVRQWPQSGELIDGRARIGENVSIAELRDGKAVRVTEYWGEPFVPPDWRQPLAEHLDMPRDGVWPAADLLEAD
jgi:hypothetical protein